MYIAFVTSTYIMDFCVSRAAKATSSMSVRRVRPPTYTCLRYLHKTPRQDATPLPHPTVPGPPPSAPHASVTFVQDRVARRKQQAELLKEGQQAKINPAKPTTALQKRFWRNVSIQDTPDGLQVMLDTRPVRTASRQILQLPKGKRALAASIAMEWDQLVSAQQALKQHYIPLTSLTSRAVDMENADKNGDASIRQAVVKMLMRYLATDTLLCWAPERNNPYDPESENGKLRQRQKEAAEPIIAFLKTHVFGGVDIFPVLGEDSIIPSKQPEMTREVIKGWIADLPAFELAALERGVLATKSLLIAARLLVSWSQQFKHLEGVPGNDKFEIDEAAEASSLELLHQLQQWGEVEDTHDVNREDLRRQLGSVVLLVS